MKFEIKSWMTGGVLFSIETDSWRLAVEAAVKAKADLRYADLSYANLRYADLSYANLRYADLSYANLRSADLSSADLSYADLSSADLSYANLRYADLRCANLSSADLSYADLSSANLRYANLRSAKNSVLAIAMTRILPEGDLIGWKKCNDSKLVKLLIPTKAKRSHAFGRKCRAEFVKVLEVVGGGTATTSSHGPLTEYAKGRTVKPDKWDKDFANECSNGIHFWITREEAEAWNE